MVLEPAGGLASGEVPQSQGLVPRAGQGKVSVRGKNLDHQLNISSSHQSNSCNEGTKSGEDKEAYHIRDEVAMAMQTLLGDAIVSNIIPGMKYVRTGKPCMFYPTEPSIAFTW